jgi:hypothetical protein
MTRRTVALGAAAAALGSTVVLAGVLATSPGCRTAPPGFRDGVPIWVQGELPQDPDHAYAVGSCPRTVAPADREREAVARARSTLGAADLSDSEVIGKWLDVDGRAGEAGSLWVLLRAPRAKPESSQEEAPGSER